LANDRILSINGHNIVSFDDIRNEVALVADDNMISMKLLRGQEEMTLTFPISEMEYTHQVGGKIKQRMLGVTSVNTVEVEHKRMNVFDAFAEACSQTWNITMMTLRGVGQMIAGRRSGEDVGGIIRIAEMSGDISKSRSFWDFLAFMALLSINLGLINLFPIPLLDGGHVIIYLLEIISRRELNTKVKDGLFKVGLGLIVALMVFATWNDVRHLITRWFE
jgi:regulator of sigma E protease